MRVVRGDDALKTWVMQRVTVESFGPSEALAVIDDEGNVLAGAVYSNYRWPDIEMTIAASSPRWAQRGIICELLAYPFYQLKTKRITALVDEENKRVRKFLRGIGFECEGCLREASEAGDILIYGMTKKDFENGAALSCRKI